MFRRRGLGMMQQDDLEMEAGLLEGIVSKSTPADLVASTGSAGSFLAATNTGFQDTTGGLTKTAVGASTTTTVLPEDKLLYTKQVMPSFIWGAGFLLAAVILFRRG